MTDFYSEWQTKNRIADGWQTTVVIVAVVLAVTAIVVAWVSS